MKRNPQFPYAMDQEPLPRPFIHSKRRRNFRKWRRRVIPIFVFAIAAFAGYVVLYNIAAAIF